MKAAPEIVFHLAAQALVRVSYAEPLSTWSTNVLGTANLLEACRNTPSVRAVVVVTTDKCYENKEWWWGYRETDSLGGHDPYGASKAAAELVVQSYRRSFFQAPGSPLVATARAGNVVGGGDWSVDRLIPDLVRAVQTNGSLELRSPKATRPWQHVLESLSGYLLLGHKLLEGRHGFDEAWNFGPQDSLDRTVEWALGVLRREWPHLRWHVSDAEQPHEASQLGLDSSKARQRLGWVPVWSSDEGLERTAHWYRKYYEQGEVSTSGQIDTYVACAAAKNIIWMV